MRKIFCLLQLFIVALIMPLHIQAQATIGGHVQPSPTSVLELIAQYQPGSYGGLRLPQVSDSEISELQAAIKSLPSEEQGRAKGLVVFNTTVSCIMVWNGAEFKSLCGDVGQAQMTLECGSVTVYPNEGAPLNIPTGYQQGLPLDPTTNYLTVPVTVTKSGTYSLTATTGNGYSFVTSGTMLDTGDYILKLTGQGTPITGNSSPQYYDNLTIFVNGDPVPSCPPVANAIPVKPAIDKANFTISSCSVQGTYTVNTALGASNTITVQVNVTGSGNYSFTATAGGMTFSRTGQWPTGTSGLQTIVLYGQGTPTAAGVVPVTITGSALGGDQTCNTNITVAYRQIKVLGLGSGIYYPNGKTDNYAPNKILKTTTNFGPTNSIVPVQGITIINGNLTNGTALTTLINNNKPDIIVIGYNYSPDATAVARLASFVNSDNGVLFAFMENSAAANVINDVCGSSITVTGRNTAGAVYPFENIDDPILKGPFGDVRGFYWGEDASSTNHVSALPAGCIAYSKSKDGTGNEMTAFRHGSKGFIYVGDGGFLSNENGGNGGSTAYPCKHTNGQPVPQTSYSRPAYNSFFYANAMAWAIDYVQRNKQ